MRSDSRFKNKGHRTKGKIDIGCDVWVGADSTILGGVNVGHGAIIGADSVVTKDVEPYSIVAGNPAKHIKYRFSEKIRNQLLELKWWEWDEEKIERNKKFFSTDLREVDDVYSLIR
ncbi:hypothetical protein C9439_03990 [archaeon SCG-AAA382B04]|nr:hypothetical protein C9439_03990 [archaeon SCG-AAA382B04]